ncbi:hypothetical protein KIPB_008614 [Kipferlia bialata]|uniref:Uncharacterized protein n=1 Tax=Kipferlia bialata TaxID=797122 RepID=A0A9K3GKY7_9EUKA|nr:hypothetical protein KIPB_008614 [Kipferlia bialata]|eukprot:g8614.t1
MQHSLSPEFIKNLTHEADHTVTDQEREYVAELDRLLEEKPIPNLSLGPFPDAKKVRFLRQAKYDIKKAYNTIVPYSSYRWASPSPPPLPSSASPTSLSMYIY